MQALRYQVTSLGKSSSVASTFPADTQHGGSSAPSRDLCALKSLRLLTPRLASKAGATQRCARLSLAARSNGRELKRESEGRAAGRALSLSVTHQPGVAFTPDASHVTLRSHRIVVPFSQWMCHAVHTGVRHTVFTLDDAVHTGVRHTVFTLHCHAVFTMDEAVHTGVHYTAFTLHCRAVFTPNAPCCSHWSASHCVHTGCSLLCSHQMMLFTLECITLCSHHIVVPFSQWMHHAVHTGVHHTVFTLDDAVHTGVHHTVFTPDVPCHVHTG